MGAEQSSQISSGSVVQQDYINFFINGEEYRVKTDGCNPEISPAIGPNYFLVDFLRSRGLAGTKYMCREGGCGACMVILKSPQEEAVKAANSCLLPLLACDGLEITTVESLGNRNVGYHPIQDRLVKFGGTQCGFCTPGIVMTMYSVVQNKPRFTRGDVEYSFDGNICRCTGYRSIIEAFKSLSVDASDDLKRKCQDIEDCHACFLAPLKPPEGLEDSHKMEIVQVPRNLHVQSVTGEQWIKVTTLSTLFEIIQSFTYSSTRYRLVAGNTGIGLYKHDGPYESYIQINDIPELHHVSFDQSGLVLGGGTTITEAIEQFREAMSMEGFVYAREFYKLLRRVASLSIRNQGTLAGNLMLKHYHRSFVSDIFVLLESVGSTLKISSSPSVYQSYSLMDFLNLDMNGKVILSIHLPIYTANYFYRTFKIGKRYQNASAYVNAAFLCNVDIKNNFTVIGKPRLCYGGINPDFVHATGAEGYLSGKPLTVGALQNVLTILGNEIAPDSVPGGGSPQYRSDLAQAYLYKFLLGIRHDAVNPWFKSGAADVERALNTASQTFETDKSKFPLYQPIPKLESLPQASGEAEFINDRKPEHNELFGAFVLTNVANASVASIDASQALMIPNVVAFITAKDIPGNNNYTVFLTQPEEIFVSRRVRYAGQPIGLVVAKDQYTAFQARSRVVVTYADIQKPVLDIKDVVQKRELGSGNESESEDDDINMAFPCRGLTTQRAKEMMMHIKRVSRQDRNRPLSQGSNTYKLKGEFRTHPQYHFHLETQICICVPVENGGMDVYSSTQHMDSVQAAIAGCLNVPNNSVNVFVRRLGGAFGAKISRAAHIATACAVAAQFTNRPVRVALDLETNMKMIGKRLPYLVKYNVEVDETGNIQKLNADMFCDTGAVSNEPTSFTFGRSAVGKILVVDITRYNSRHQRMLLGATCHSFDRPIFPLSNDMQISLNDLFGMICMQSCYRADWNIRPGVAVTDTAPNTYCRSPGSAQGVAAIEYIMEHIAFTLQKDPLEIRQVNFIQRGDPFIGIPGAKLPFDNLLPEMIKELKETSDFASRKGFVETFNRTNRWKKRGISMVPQRYPNYYPDLKFPTFIAVYHVDGTVSVSHGGIEMGQGINTKVAQVVARTLQIPIAKVRIQPSNNVTSPNSAISGASIASELVCSSARRACEQLLERLAPIRTALGNPTWEQLIAAANSQDVLLTSHYQDKQGTLLSYDVWGVTVIEIEMDVLTGDYKIIRADIMEDAGQSLNPLIDIGQIEGGFIMGLSFWLNEELVYDPTTGVLLTNNTSTYKPMLPADIPEDLRVNLLRRSPNAFGVLSSKAVGEPPFNMAVAVVFALRNAINSARKDAGNNEWYQLDGPVTRETIRRLTLCSPSQFVF